MPMRACHLARFRDGQGFHPCTVPLFDDQVHKVNTIYVDTPNEKGARYDNVPEYAGPPAEQPEDTWMEVVPVEQ